MEVKIIDTKYPEIGNNYDGVEILILNRRIILDRIKSKELELLLKINNRKLFKVEDIKKGVINGS